MWPALVFSFQLPHVVVNCVECYSQRLLFECILNAAANHTPSKTNGYASYAKCDNLCDMLRILKQLLADQKETFYVVSRKDF